MGIENIKLGVSTVKVNGVDVGLTSGGVTITLTPNKRETVIDHFGTVERRSITTSTTSAIAFTILETQLANLRLILQGTYAAGSSSIANGDGQSTSRIDLTISSPGVTYQFPSSEIDTIQIAGKSNAELAYTLNATCTMIGGLNGSIS